MFNLANFFCLRTYTGEKKPVFVDYVLAGFVSQNFTVLKIKIFPPVTKEATITISL